MARDLSVQGFGQHHLAVFPALTIPHHEHLAVQIQILHPQPQAFHLPQTRAVEQL